MTFSQLLVTLIFGWPAFGYLANDKAPVFDADLFAADEQRDAERTAD